VKSEKLKVKNEKKEIDRCLRLTGVQHFTFHISLFTEVFPEQPKNWRAK
jgi:hypothetical protein